VASNFEEIGAFPGIRNKDSAEEVAGVWGNIVGECERSVDDVLVEEVDVVAFGICRIVVEGEIAGQHGVLFHGQQSPQAQVLTQPTNITPQLQTSTFLPVYNESLTTSSGAA